MSKIKYKCDSYCNGKLDFSDGVFTFCECEARNMNTLFNSGKGVKIRFIGLKLEEKGNVVNTEIRTDGTAED